jgi:hypothetical protein
MHQQSSDQRPAEAVTATGLALTAMAEMAGFPVRAEKR